MTSIQSWTRAFFNEHCKCDMVDNNIYESFNEILLDARGKCITTMFETIRDETIARIERKSIFVTKRKQNYGPLVKDKFDARKAKAKDWKMVKYGENGCEVKKRQNKVCR